MDWTTILATALGSVITLAGILLASTLDARREGRRSLERHLDERRGRIRERDLRALDETRQVLVGLLSSLERRIVLGDIRASQPDTEGLTRYNINLVGDADVIRRYGEVVSALQEGLPMTAAGSIADALRNLVPQSLADLDTDMIQRTTRLRAELLQALDAQEDRVLQDEPLLTLTAEQLESIAPADAMVDMLRERQRAHRSDPAR